MARPVADLYDRVRHLVPELAKFGVVGGIGTIVDIGGAAVLHSKYHMGPLTAKGVSISLAALVTYLGSRYWTFRHRDNQPLLREGMLFIALNLVGLLLAEAVIACTTYVLGYKGLIAYNLASLFGTGLGTIFRFFAYRKWVFLAPATQEAGAVPEPAVGHAPWELMDWEPAPAGPRAAWQVRQPRHVRLQDSVIPNGAVATPLATAAAQAWPPPAPAWQPAPAFQPVPTFQPAPAFQPAPTFQSAATFQPAATAQAASAWQPAPMRPAARHAPTGPRSAGRHRKR